MLHVICFAFTATEFRITLQNDKRVSKNVMRYRLFRTLLEQGQLFKRLFQRNTHGAVANKCEQQYGSCQVRSI